MFPRCGCIVTPRGAGEPDRYAARLNLKQRYRNYEVLAEHEIRGKDYRIVVERRHDSAVAVIAPHGGAIERRTSQIARAIAGTDCSLYLFEGIKAAGNYDTLHLTSTTFDEPECLALVGDCAIVLTVHGCEDLGGDVHVGGLDIDRAGAVGRALSTAGLTVLCPSAQFPGREPRNICNRGRTQMGVQLEFSTTTRIRFRPDELAEPIRRVISVESEGDVGGRVETR